MPFDEQLAYSDRETIRDHQIKSLRKLLSEIDGKNPFWTKRFADTGLKSADIQTWEDFQKIPILQKSKLVEDQTVHPPYGTNLTYPLTGYNRLHQTSGTTGISLSWLDTPESWNWFMNCWEQIYSFVGLTSEDRLMFPFSFGPFIGFWAAFEGSQKLGHLSIPGGGMSSIARIQLIQKYLATFICCTPTYALRLLEVAESSGINLSQSSVRGLIVAGEPGGNIPAIKQRIEKGWGARMFDHWGMTEIGALGIECVESSGTLTLLESECIAEILDPKTFEPVARGELGELVITNLGRTGSPLIRYRTGDLVKEETEPCPSGRKYTKLSGGILSRSDDMILIRGNNVYPSSIEAMLREFDEIVEYQIHVETVQSMSHLKIEIEPKATLESDEKNQLVQRVGSQIRDRLNFHAEIVAVAPESLPRFELKGRRFHRNDETST